MCCVSIPEAGHLVPTVQVGFKTRGKDEATSQAFDFVFFGLSDGDFPKPWDTSRDPNVMMVLQL